VGLDTSLTGRRRRTAIGSGGTAEQRDRFGRLSISDEHREVVGGDRECGISIQRAAQLRSVFELGKKPE
jgi:hypothetical protein